MANAMVALDFSEGLLPGWHSTLLPPFFVADALFSGFALLLVLVLVLRPIYRLETWIPDAQIDLLARGLLAASLVVAYSYAMEIFGGHYTGDPDELALLSDRATGLYAPTYWATLILNVALPQLLWWPQLRARPVVLFLVGGGVVIGTWIERFMLQVTTLYHGYLPSADGRYAPTFWDWAILLGSIGAFALLFLLFVRLLPLLPMFEIRRRGYRECGS
jgi:molybdopterin-containing oxidoreductase family membrane subunit